MREGERKGESEGEAKAVGWIEREGRQFLHRLILAIYFAAEIVLSNCASTTCEQATWRPN